MNKVVGFAMCGSFCTFSKAFEQMIKLKAAGAELTRRLKCLKS